MPANEPDRNAIPSGAASGMVREALEKFLTASRDWQISGPAIAAVLLLDVGGFRLWYHARFYMVNRAATDRIGRT